MPLSRVPPGQRLVETFQVLHYSGVPNISLQAWRLRVFGLVEEPLELSWEEFLALPQASIRGRLSLRDPLEQAR